MQSDFRWLWAAYKMDAYKDVLPSDLDDDTFTETVLDIIDSSDAAFMLEGWGDGSPRPIGIVLGRVFGKGRCLEPHVDWFPWATARNKMEGSAAFFREVKRSYKLFVFAEEDTVPFWDRLTQYRLLRRGCKIIDHYGVGKHGFMYYTVGF